MTASDAFDTHLKNALTSPLDAFGEFARNVRGRVRNASETLAPDTGEAGEWTIVTRRVGDVVPKVEEEPCENCNETYGRKREWPLL